jgi:ATP-dependent Clp protease ATP-binding subunit ClpA
LETVRQTVTATLPPPTDQVPELIPYDARARKALEPTFRQALRMGHNYIGTEDILLALLELDEPAGVLAELGVDKATAEANITAAVAATLAARDQN